MSLDQEKQLAAEAAAALVKAGMTIGLGSGSTVAFLLQTLARLKFPFQCVASSPNTEQLARSLGLHVESFDRLSRLDLSIDGVDQITPDGWLIKGKGRAHTREKIIAAASDRFVVIADSTKPIPTLQGSVPVELLSFGLPATLRQIEPAKLRNVPPSPDGGVIADYHGPLIEPALVAAWLDSIPGVVEHGLFPPELVTEAFIARGNTVEHRMFNREARS